MSDKSRAVLFVILATIFTSIAQILYKISSANLPRFPENISGISNFFYALAGNYALIGGLLLYAAGAFLLIIALKNGELSLLYPIIAMSYIWVSILSTHFLNERMGLFKWGGIGLIIIGVSLIGYGSGNLSKRKKRNKKVKETNKKNKKK